METFDALYKTICEQPSEDTPRLMFADLLDETPNYVDCVCAQYEGMRSSSPGMEETLRNEEASGALTLSDCWVPCEECDGSQRIDLNKVRAEFIRLSISLRNPPDETNMGSVAEWNERAKRSVALCKANYERWVNWTCNVCNGIGKGIKLIDRSEWATYQDKGKPYDEIDCPACFRTGSLYQSRNLSRTTRRHIEFMRGFPVSVSCRSDELSTLWATKLVPTLWVEEIVKRTPITRFLVTNVMPYKSNERVTHRSRVFHYNWYPPNWERTHGVIPEWLYNRMRLTDTSEPIKEHQPLRYNSERAAREALGDMLGEMIREMVYGTI